MIVCYRSLFLLGKHDSESLLLCDSCDNEWHTYCLAPPLDTIPEGHWFCLSCIKQGKDKDIEDNEQVEDEDDERDDDEVNQDEDDDGDEETKEIDDEGMFFYYDDEEEDGNDEEYEEYNFKPKKSHKKQSHFYSVENDAPVRRPGRPKGSVGKKRAEMLHSVYGGDSQAMQAALRARKKTPGSGKKKRKRKRGDYDGEYDNTTGMGTVINEPVGVEGAWAIALRSSRRCLLPSELFILESYREWAPVGDLKQTLEVFKAQKALLQLRLESDNNNKDCLAGNEEGEIDDADAHNGTHDDDDEEEEEDEEDEDDEDADYTL